MSERSAPCVAERVTKGHYSLEAGPPGGRDDPAALRHGVLDLVLVVVSTAEDEDAEHDGDAEDERSRNRHVTQLKQECA